MVTPLSATYNVSGGIRSKLAVIVVMSEVNC
jgi:hypothetical protein